MQEIYERDIRTLFDSSDDDSLPDTSDGRLAIANGASDISEVVQPNPFEWVSVDPGYLDKPDNKRTLCCTRPVSLPIDGVPICTVPYEWGMFFSAEAWIVRIPTIQSHHRLEIVDILGDIDGCRELFLWVCEHGLRSPRYIGLVNVE